MNAWSRKTITFFNYRLRSLLPETLKRILRALRLIVAPIPTSAPQLPQRLLDDCQFVSSRFDLLPSLPSGGRVCEVGVFRGDFSRKILDHCAPEELHLIDIDFRLLRADVRSSQAVTLHRALSVVALETFPDGYFDWIYIDGDHTYEGVRRDIQNAMHKVRPDGFLVFNDFARIARNGLGTFGVHQAVSEFAVAHEWPVAYFCFQSEALYDVALRKPVRASDSFGPLQSSA